MFALFSGVLLLYGVVDPQGVEGQDGSVNVKDAGEQGVSGGTGFSLQCHVVPEILDFCTER